jgi:uncharacterized membrane protein
MNFFDWLKEHFQDSPRQVTGAVAGFLCALIFIVIGFWNFILIILITLLGLAIGRLSENNWDASSLFRGTSSRRDRDDG